MPISNEQAVARPSSRPAQWVERHGDALFAYALLRVRQRDVAEDLVQECFLAALRSRENFSGASSERTWLIGILKHKILDHFRQTPPEECVDETLADIDRLMFTEKGFWKVKVRGLGCDPQALLENMEFWEVLRQCLQRLPRSLSAAFTLRELEQCRSEEVCQVLGVTPTNLWARLHRARLGLRHCLDVHWLKRESSSKKRSSADGEGDP